jgi:UDP-3-O-[3-hydroxymyristoyl] glucosamine N-acyltransferase
MTLNQIAEFLEIPNSFEETQIAGINNLANANINDISFILDKKYKNELLNTKAPAILVSDELKSLIPENKIALVVQNPQIAMAKVTKLFFKQPKFYKSKKFLGVYIGENVKIGQNCQIYPNVTIYPNTIIGNNVIIHSGSTIGSDGFGYAHDKNSNRIKIYHFGNVIIEDNVEIGANSCIDRATFGSTIIKQGSKIDNLVQIAHNVILEENVIVVSQSGVAGSSKIGKNTILAAQSGVSDHIEIADNVVIAARGGVVKNIKNPGVYAGFPAISHKLWLKIQAKISRLIKN